MKKIAAFDIGSNAIRMAIGELDLDGKFSMVKRIRTPIRLGAEVFSGLELSYHTREAVVKNFIEFKKIMDHEGVSLYKAVATSALRNSINASELIEDILTKTGIQVDLIDGQLEAALVRKAILTKIDLTRKDFLLIDIGGGSAELSLLKKGEILGAMSLPMGAVRLLEIGKVAARNGMGPEQGYREYLNHLNPEIENFFDQYYHSVKSIRVIGTGGNFKRLGRLRKKVLGIKNVEHVLPDEVAAIREAVEEIPLLDRTKKLGLRHDRADVIVPAIYIIENIMSHVPMKKLFTPDIGLIHGVLYRICDDITQDQGATSNKNNARKKVKDFFYRRIV